MSETLNILLIVFAAALLVGPVSVVADLTKHGDHTTISYKVQGNIADARVVETKALAANYAVAAGPAVTGEKTIIVAIENDIANAMGVKSRQ